MFFYAQLNENNIVIAVTQTADTINLPDMISLNFLDISVLGKKYEDGNFIDIPQPAQPRIITKTGMLTKRLTMQEFVGILTAAKTDPAIEAWKYVFDSSTQVDLDSQNTKDGMAMLVAKGLLTQERADQILTAPVQPEERP